MYGIRAYGWNLPALTAAVGENHPQLSHSKILILFISLVGKDRREEKRLGSMMFPAFKLQKILRAKVNELVWKNVSHVMLYA